MQVVRWTTFGVSSAITKTVLHFFPAAASTSAPYPVSVNLSVFSREFPRKSLTIEGGRLGQPDGFRLEEAIPSLAEALPGFIGIQVELSSPQPRIDLSPSCCIVEIVSTAQSVKFCPPVEGAPLRTSSESSEKKLESFAAMQDAFGVSSLLIVNASEKPFITRVVSPELSVGNGKLDAISFSDVAPGSVSEVPVSEHLMQAQAPQECSWGLLRSRVLLFERTSQPGVSFFGIFRENVAKRIVSVVAL